jgi:hypothetical protein
MQASIATWLPWLLSAITIVTSFMQGNKHPKAWLLSLGGQGIWAIYIVAAEAWGFVPLTAMLIAVYWRNHLKWKREVAEVPAALHAAEALKPYLQEAEDDLIEWRLRALKAEARLSDEEGDHIPPQPGDPLYLCSQIKPLPEGGAKKIKFRRYTPPVTLGDYVDNVQRYENGIDFAPATAVPGIEVIEVQERP